jgi:hypothetical protein
LRGDIYDICIYCDNIGLEEAWGMSSLERSELIEKLLQKAEAENRKAGKSRVLTNRDLNK